MDRQHPVEEGMTRIVAAGWCGAALAALVVAGCGGGSAASGKASETATVAPAGAKASGAAKAEAQQVYATRCAVCHGPTGRGDGPGAPGLTPKPRDYHDAAWQASVTDPQIEQTIVYGGAAVGKSPAMVANPDLGAKPELVAALRELIRDFGKE
jgi:mono/diheme cytochrome c family protein